MIWCERAIVAPTYSHLFQAFPSPRGAGRERVRNSGTGEDEDAEPGMRSTEEGSR